MRGRSELIDEEKGAGAVTGVLADDAAALRHRFIDAARQGLDDPGKGPSAFFLSHGATTSEIGTGDVLIERVTANGETKEFPTAIQYIFGTIPALHSYGDGQGDAGTVSYPVEPPSCAEGPCPGPPGPGALENPIPVKAGPDGHVKLTLTFWRPQRTPIPGEAGYGSPGSWIDIGGLSYGISPDFEGNTCQQSAFSTSDSNLTPNSAADALASGGFTDRAQDRPASSTNTLTFTVDISECVASAGKSLHAGEVLTLSLMASACGSESCVNGNSSGPDSAGQLFSIKLP